MYAAAFAFILPERTQQEPVYYACFDEALDKNVSASTDLQRDCELMWQTVALEVGFRVSPTSSINAASRVFAYVEPLIIGKPMYMVEELLCCPRERVHYIYQVSFFPPLDNEQVRVFRFDCGYFGWQFDLLLDELNCVSKVRGRWIH